MIRLFFFTNNNSFNRSRSMFRDLHDDIERIRREHDIGIAEMEKDLAYKVSLTQSPLALRKTRILAMNQHPRNGCRQLHPLLN